MNSELGIRNVGCVLALVMTFFTACTDYQEQFDNNFAALEYGDIENPELSSGVVPGSSHGATPASSASVSSGAEPLSSGAVPASSGAEPLSSGTVPISSGAEQSSSSTPPVVGNVLTDSRNGKEYRLVTIGEQKWMAENLNYKTPSSRCYDDDENNCSKFGRLYTWADAQNVCPAGTHLPTAAEMNILAEHILDSLNRSANDGAMLKSKEGWAGNSANKGVDFYGFTALPAGMWKDGKYVEKDSTTIFWSADEAIGRKITYGNSLFGKFINQPLENGYSVRCLVGEKKAEVTSSSSAVATSCMVSEGNCFEDSRDHKTYRTVEIGQQTWMAENLKYYGSLEKVICYKDDSTYCKKYGGLYNISSTYSLQDVCPDGWHVPDSMEWNNLFVQAGGINDAGKYLKSETGWDKNGGGNDAFGFSALPGGYSTDRYASGSVQAGGGAYFLTSSELKSSQITNEVYVAQFYHDDSAAGLVSMQKELYVSVRCIKGAKPSSSSSVKSSSSETSSSSSSFGSSGSFTYVINGKTYTSSYVRHNGLIWMNQDLINSVWGHSSGEWNGAPKYFTWSEAKKACPNGWRLPHADEINKSSNLENNSSFNATEALPGYFLYNKWHKEGEEGMYWTGDSTGDYADVFSLKKNGGAGKIVSVNKGFEDESIKLPIRCVQPSGNVFNNPRSSSLSIKNLLYYYNLSEEKCYDGNKALCRVYGNYFTWNKSVQINNACSNYQSNWVLPTKSDINKLLETLDDAHKLASVGMGGTNEFEFDFVPSGHFVNSGSFKTADESDYAACFWLFTANAPDNVADAFCFTKNPSGSVSGSIVQLPIGEYHPIRLIRSPGCK